jgi:hypothetical protein
MWSAEVFVAAIDLLIPIKVMLNETNAAHVPLPVMKNYRLAHHRGLFLFLFLGFVLGFVGDAFEHIGLFLTFIRELGQTEPA